LDPLHSDIREIMEYETIYLPISTIAKQKKSTKITAADVISTIKIKTFHAYG